MGAIDFERRQFRVLFEQFLFKVVDVELLSAQADPTKLLGQIATVLLSFSFLVSIPVLFMGGGRLPLSGARLMEHFFIATTMLVVGIFAVLSWDAVFPSLQDVLVLGSLPIRARTMFAARMAAIGVGLGVAAGAVNGISGMLWPWMFAAPGSGAWGPVRSFAAFWVTLLAAGMFVFGAALTLQGMARMMPRRMHLRISPVLQVAVFCALVSVYVLEPSLERDAALVANHRLLEWLPSYWFWGMYQQLNGTASLRELHWPAVRSWSALGLAGAGGIATVLFSYARGMRRVVEEPEVVPGRAWVSWMRGGTVERAVVLFALQTIFRSRQHRMMLSFYMGAGFGVTLILLRPAMGRHGVAAVALMAASVLMLCTATVAVRTVVSMPIAPGANWVFRVAEMRPAAEYVKAARKVFLVMAVMPVWSAFAVLLLWELPWRAAAAHLALLGLLGMMLTDAASGGFRKVPFTCSYQPGKTNLQFAVWGALVLVPLTVIGAHYEWRLLASERGMIEAASMLVLPAGLMRWLADRRMGAVEELQFEDAEDAPLVSLELTAETQLLNGGERSAVVGRLAASE